MKSKLSTLVVLLVGLIYISTSLIHFSNDRQVKVTTWDALGYYLYLPATFIYNDLDKLSFYPKVEAKYQLQGKPNEFYQFSKLKNNNFTGKYFVGVAILQSPFFFLAHTYAKSTASFEADGFSTPYQYSIILAALFYLIFALFLLRSCLLHFFTDHTVASTILLIGLATNLIQYCSIDVGQSHVYLFFLYALIIKLCIRWHKNHLPHDAIYIGLCIGLATICRPTEIIMLFIPLLWQLHNKEQWSKKINKLFIHEKYILYTTISFLLILGIQLTYWKYSTGDFIYNVGSKWNFLNPHWRVLFGFEKGWFIYTPITIFFIIGLVLLKGPYKTAVRIFCILNIWIVIAWADWRYGGSYSTRALVQSYPIFAFGLAAFISYLEMKKGKYVFYILGIYLMGVNLFQVYQYNKGILHYDKMNYEYYKRIYLNPNVTEEDLKLLSN